MNVLQKGSLRAALARLIFTPSSSLWHHICGASFAHAGSSRLFFEFEFWRNFCHWQQFNFKAPLDQLRAKTLSHCHWRLRRRACLYSFHAVYINRSHYMRMRYSIRTAFAVLSIAQSCSGFVAVGGGKKGSSANRVSWFRAQNEKNTSSYETSDASSKGIVSSLTGLVNLIMTRTASKQDGNKGEMTRRCEMTNIFSFDGHFWFSPLPQTHF
jgi:hypothetical protein